MICLSAYRRLTRLTLAAIRLSLLLTLLLLEPHVAIVHDGTNHLIDAIFVFLGEAQHIKSILVEEKMHGIVSTIEDHG